MSQSTFLRDFDALAHACFERAGLAGHALYTAPDGGSAMPRRVYVNHAQQIAGEFGQVVAPRTVVGVLLADGAVTAGGRVAVGDKIYVLQRRDETNEIDGSLDWWVVRHG